MKFLTWNLAMLPFPSCVTKLKKSPKERLKQILSLAEKLAEFDVLLFNEVFIGDIEHGLIEGLKSDFPFHMKSNKKWYKLLGNGLLMLSKYEIRPVEERIFGDYWGWDFFTSKGYQCAQLSYGKYTYYVINTHMQQGDTIRENQARGAQCDEITACINRIKLDEKTRIVFGGDLNMELSNKKFRDLEYKKFRRIAELDEPNYAYKKSDEFIVRFLLKNVNTINSCYFKNFIRNWIVSDTDPLALVLD